MTNDTPEHDIAKIHDLLLAAFTPEELRRFCYDRSDFRPVVNRFARATATTTGWTSSSPTATPIHPWGIGVDSMPRMTGER